MRTEGSQTASAISGRERGDTRARGAVHETQQQTPPTVRRPDERQVAEEARAEESADHFSEREPAHGAPRRSSQTLRKDEFLKRSADARRSVKHLRKTLVWVNGQPSQPVSPLDRSGGRRTCRSGPSCDHWWSGNRKSKSHDTTLIAPKLETEGAGKWVLPVPVPDRIVPPTGHR